MVKWPCSRTTVDANQLSFSLICHSRGIKGPPCSQEDVSHTATCSGHRWYFKLVILEKLKRLPDVCTYIITEGNTFNYKCAMSEWDRLCAHAEECSILLLVEHLHTVWYQKPWVTHTRVHTHTHESYCSCDLPKGMTQSCSSHKDVL